MSNGYFILNGNELYKPDFKPTIEWTYDIKEIKIPKFDSDGIQKRPTKVVLDDFVLSGAL